MLALPEVAMQTARRLRYDYTAQERAAKVAWLLSQGNCLTTGQVAEITGLTLNGAYHLMAYHICRVIPVWCNRGRWEVCRTVENC